MKYQLTIVDKTATVDDYNDGEIGESNNFYIGEKFTGETIKEVIEKACDFIGGEYEGAEQCWQAEIDAEDGRIDFQTLETDSGEQPGKAEISAWKRGKHQLWACYYVGFVEKLAPVNLTKVKELR